MANAFKLEETDEKFAVLTFDLPDAKVNTLGGAVLRELLSLVESLERRSDLRGLLLRSGKPGQFIAGADLNEIAALAYVMPEQAKAGVLAGHALFNRISQLPFPTVALIDGPCMGGGTELVLAMDYRICSNQPKTQITLPEIKVGVIPGWGGTQRLPRLIGVPNAIEMICSGESVPPAKAVALGLVFDAVPAEKLIAEGKRLLEEVLATGVWKEDRVRRSQPVGLTPDQFAFTFATAEGYIREKTKGQYPAPLVALSAIKEGCNLPLDKALEVEQKHTLEVMGSPISANLIAVFFMTNRLERDPGVADKSITPANVQHAGVLGAGLMGAGIATALARSGMATALVDVDDERIAAGVKRMRGVIESRIKIGRASHDDLADMLSRVSLSTSHALFAGCDVVIEAITENEQAKREAYQQLAGVLKPDAILASNTSTISITRLAESAPNAERFVGMHFFNPVDRMPLVEVIRGSKTSDATVATIVALAKRARKTPIVVRDCAGFLVNRILFPYMSESIQLLLEGADMDQIDNVATRFGMPMGPILLHDVVGLDTAWYAGTVVHKAYANRALQLPILGEMVKLGRLGQKSGAGFRKYGGKNLKGTADPDFAPILERHRVADRKFDDETILDRLLLPMLFEATRCLEEKIVGDPASLDMGLILGIGFPAFRGGLLRWCDQEGAEILLQRAEKYADLGPRFHPTDTLILMASSGDKFFPRPKELPKFGT